MQLLLDGVGVQLVVAWLGVYAPWDVSGAQVGELSALSTASQATVLTTNGPWSVVFGSHVPLVFFFFAIDPRLAVELASSFLSGHRLRGIDAPALGINVIDVDIVHVCAELVQVALACGGETGTTIEWDQGPVAVGCLHAIVGPLVEKAAVVSDVNSGWLGVIGPVGDSIADHHTFNS